MAKWRTLSSQKVYETPWMRVHRNEVLNQNGKQLTYSFVELCNPSVFIVAVNAQGQIYLQRNYRYTLDKNMWEVPAGFADEQNVLTGAKRELLEETGLASDDWTELGTLYQANGIGNIPFTAFLARNVQAASGSRDPDEDISSGKFVDPATIEAMIRQGEFIESAHIAALYLARLHGLKKEKH